MKQVRLAMSVLLMLGAQVAIDAQTIEVSLIETMPASGTAMTRQSEYVISGALDALFEAGMIGTNARPVAGAPDSLTQFVPDQDAAEAMIDYVVAILAEYDGRTPVPSCRYRLIRIRDGQDVESGAVPAAVPRSALDADVEKACIEVGSAVIAACFPSR